MKRELPWILLALTAVGLVLALIACGNLQKANEEAVLQAEEALQQLEEAQKQATEARGYAADVEQQLAELAARAQSLEGELETARDNYAAALDRYNAAVTDLDGLLNAAGEIVSPDAVNDMMGALMEQVLNGSYTGGKAGGSGGSSSSGLTWEEEAARAILEQAGEWSVDMWDVAWQMALQELREEGYDID